MFKLIRIWRLRRRLEAARPYEARRHAIEQAIKARRAIAAKTCYTFGKENIYLTPKVYGGAGREYKWEEHVA